MSIIYRTEFNNLIKIMAQHIPLMSFNNKRLKGRAMSIKRQGRISKGSLKWNKIGNNRYQYVKGIKVSNSIVMGGYADIEVETHNDNNIKEVYLVA